jgi:hypothetical protein
MRRSLLLSALVILAVAAPLRAEVKGHYIEARTCDVWTGPCFANAEVNLTGRHAVIGWKVEKGTLDGVTLDGLGIVAVVAASDTLGVTQTGAAKAVLIVDSRANPQQRAALIRLAKAQGGQLLANVISVESATVDLEVCPCADGGCGKLTAGAARIETRCLDHKSDKICGNESAFFPPLSAGVKVHPAVAVEHSFAGKGMGETWKDAGRRGAYLGSFEMR